MRPRTFSGMGNEMNTSDDLGLPNKRLLSVEETAAYLGISARTIYNQVGRKAKRPFPIKAKRIGKLVKFDIREIDRYIESL